MSTQSGLTGKGTSGQALGFERLHHGGHRRCHLRVPHRRRGPAHSFPLHLSLTACSQRTGTRTHSPRPLSLAWPLVPTANRIVLKTLKFAPSSRLHTPKDAHVELKRDRTTGQALPVAYECNPYSANATACAAGPDTGSRFPLSWFPFQLSLSTFEALRCDDLRGFSERRTTVATAGSRAGG